MNARDAKELMYTRHPEFLEAITAYRRTGPSKATDAQLMAFFCDSVLESLVGAASPTLVWEGAQKQGMTTVELQKLCKRAPLEVHDLMW